jgi:phosphoenolpyruvate phosphomutase
MREWGDRAPVVIVPTKYYSTPVEVFRSAGVSVVIWANHLLRAAAQAMQDTARQIARDQSLADVEDRIASIDEIFRLQGADELVAAEQRYLASQHAESSAIILGATEGRGLSDLTADRPKLMVSVAGRPILRRLADDFKRQNVNRITAVTGYCAEAVQEPGVQTVFNPEYATAGELLSLACAAEAFTDDTIICYGDLLFRHFVLADLLERDAPLTVVVDSAHRRGRISGTPDYAYCSRPDDLDLWQHDVLLEHVSSGVEHAGRSADGRWIGLLRARGEGMRWLREAMAELAAQPDYRALALCDLLNHLLARQRPIAVNYIQGRWLDVNTLRDLEHAETFAHNER